MIEILVAMDKTAYSLFKALKDELDRSAGAIIACKNNSIIPARFVAVVLVYRLLLATFLGLTTLTPALADDPIPVLTQPLYELALYPESTAAAQVISLNDAAIAAQVNALVAEVLVRVGDTVKAGAVLLKLDCKDFELERVRLKAEGQAVKARLELAQWQLKQSELLAFQHTLPVEIIQQRRSELAVLRGDLAAHAARIETTQRQIAHCNVKAPFTGVVTARSTAVGQLVSSGTVLVHLLDLTRAEVSAQVSSPDITALRDAGELAFEHEGQHYPLKLRAVLPTIQTQSGTQEVRLDFVDKRSQPGAAGRLVWHDQTLHIASELLVKRGEQLGVFTEQAGIAHFHPLPDAQNGRPAVIGLSPDTLIIVSGQYSLNEGSKVKAQVLAKTAPQATNKPKP
jgi:RND family efflux transporter MFP subunit